MSMGATLSVMGLYNYDKTLFDLMSFPDGFTEEQKEITIDNILVECSELECLYPNPSVMKNVIGIWSKKEVPYWTRIYNASLLEYDPIENYRRNEIESINDDKTEQHSGSDVTNSSGTDTNRTTGTDVNRASGSDTNTGTSSSTDQESGTDTQTNKITSFDSNDLVTHDSGDTLYGHKNTNSASGSNTQTYGKVDTMEHGRVDSMEHGKQDIMQHGEKIKHDGITERSLLAFGNIGTMTTQEMLTAETEVAKIIQVIPIIIDSFINRFCLLVY